VEALARHPHLLSCRQWPHEQRPAIRLLLQRNLLSTPSTKGILSGWPLKLESREPVFSEEEPDENAIWIKLLQNSDTFFRGQVTDFYMHLAGLYDKPVARFFLEKTSARALYDFLTVFGTEVRPIFLIRDPRDALLSAFEFFQRTPGHEYLNGNHDDKFLNLLRGHFGRTWISISRVVGWMNSRRLPVLLVRYEDLIREPGQVFDQVEQFLGIDTGNHELMSEPINDEGAHAHHRTTASVAATVGRWKKELSAEREQQVIEALGVAMETLGYKR